MAVFMNTLEMEPEGDGLVITTVRVRHAKMTPENVYLFRARLQALASAGTIRSVEKGLRDLTETQVERLTEIRSVGGVDKGYFSEVDDVVVAVKIPVYKGQS